MHVFPPAPWSFSGPVGEVAVRWTILPWQCHYDGLLADGLSLPGVRWHGTWLSPPGQLSRFFGRDTPLTNEGSLGPQVLRPAWANNKRYALRIDGVAFGTRRFVRVAEVLVSVPFVGPGETGARFTLERWRFTFTRCPSPKPC